MKNIFIVLLMILVIACGEKKERADLMVINAKVYTVDSTFSIQSAFAVKDGQFLAVGESDVIKNQFEADELIDAGGAAVFPGLIDAHCHFYELGLTQELADLVGTESFEEVLERIQKFANEKKPNVIRGRGWDQNDWNVQEFPTKAKLDELFPNTPVVLERVDGHAFLVNQKALDMAGIDGNTSMAGGEVIKNNGSPTGVLVDSPMQMVTSSLPPPDRATQIRALLNAQNICFENGLTTVDDAGLSRDVIELIDSLQQAGELSMRIYAMASNSEENLDHYLNGGMLKTDHLNVRSIKVYADGALGSRGAALKEPYTDHPGHLGAMITTQEELEELAKRIARAGYQMNTHAIGDSANVAVLRAYSGALQGKVDHRWRVEHAQILTGDDFDYFESGIVPSVQPTHATSDMYWAESRLGKERVKGAYAWKTLLEKGGVVALGTDFPVEEVNPMYTFYAAVARKDLKGYPDEGYQMEDALSREEALRGMTIWAAYSNFEEEEKGSIEVGKFADFVILDKDIMQVPLEEVPSTKVDALFVDGDQVFP